MCGVEWCWAPLTQGCTSTPDKAVVSSLLSKAHQIRAGLVRAVIKQNSSDEAWDCVCGSAEACKQLISDFVLWAGCVDSFRLRSEGAEFSTNLFDSRFKINAPGQ
jgi:hypothetical protein